MTEFEIQRTAQAVVDMLLSDDRFLRRMEKLTPKRQSRLLNTAQASEMLGISKDLMRDIAPYIGGIKKGRTKRDKWTFDEDGLKERYMEYVNSKL